jgi:hypothetical protein
MAGTFSNLATASDYNNRFMNNNPQYGYNGQSNPTTVTPAMNAQTGNGGQTIGSMSQPVNTSNPSQPQTPVGQATGGLLNLGNGAASGQVYNAGQTLQGLATGNPQAGINPTNQNNLYNSQGLLGNIAQNQTPAVQQAQQQYNDFSKANPYLLSDVRNNPNVAAEVSVGRGQALGQTLSGEQQALAQNVSNALAGQGQQISSAADQGQLASTGQGQQISAAGNAGQLGINQQGTQISALSSVPGPVSGPGGVLYQPQSVGGDASGNTTFGGGQAGAQVGLGAQYTNNSATLGALTGSNDGSGNSGMVGDFNSALQQSGLNSGTVNLGNALQQGLSANTSGQYAALQNNFQNILAQYAKILGTQTVNSLMTSSQNQTISQFFDSLSKEAQNVQKGNYSAGTGNSQSNQSNNSNTSFTEGQTGAGGTLVFKGGKWVVSQ